MRRRRRRRLGGVHRREVEETVGKRLSECCDQDNTGNTGKVTALIDTPVMREEKKNPANFSPF